MRYLAVIGIVAVTTQGLAQDAAPQPKAPESIIVRQTITPDFVNRDIDKAAQEAERKGAAAAARYPRFNIAWPNDVGEFGALAKQTVLLLTVVTQKAEELPVKRVYIRAGGKDVDAVKLSSWRSEIDAGRTAYRLFGRYREDGFYLLPAATLMREGVVYADWSANRTEMAIVRTPTRAAADNAKTYPKDVDPAPGARPNPQALKSFIERKFTGFPVPSGSPQVTAAGGAAPVVNYPAWTGERPTMPVRYSTQNLDPEQIFRAAASSVYLVVARQTAERQGMASIGSAVAISDGMALTNCHVIGDNKFVTLQEDKSSRMLKATVVRGDQRTDRCVLRVEGKLNPIAAVRRVKDLAVGARVYTIGNPSGLTKSLGEGLISGLRENNGIRYVQTTAQISRGSSGGALVDATGALVGITTFLLRDAQNLNFAIAAEEYWR